MRQPGLLSWLAALAGGAARRLGRLAKLALLGRSADLINLSKSRVFESRARRPNFFKVTKILIMKSLFL